MDIFSKLPDKKKEYLNYMFQTCTDEVRYYMSLIERDKNVTLIKAGGRCVRRVATAESVFAEA